MKIQPYKPFKKWTPQEVSEILELNPTCFNESREISYPSTGVKNPMTFFTEVILGLDTAKPVLSNNWQTRYWLEDIGCVLDHGCCGWCPAREACKKISTYNFTPRIIEKEHKRRANQRKVDNIREQGRQNEIRQHQQRREHDRQRLLQTLKGA